MPTRRPSRPPWRLSRCNILQFHGDGRKATVAAATPPFTSRRRGHPEMDLVQYAARCPSAQAILLDACVEGYGGGGQTFDWSLIPAGPLGGGASSGGLDAGNVGEAIRRVRPAAVDVSSGVEVARGSRMRPHRGFLWRQCGRRKHQRLTTMRKHPGGVTRTSWRRHLADHT